MIDKKIREGTEDKEYINAKETNKKTRKELHVKLSERMTKDFEAVAEMTEMRGSEIVRMGVSMVIEKYLKDK